MRVHAMSEKELHRAQVLDRWIDRRITARQARQDLGVCRSQSYNLRAAYARHGFEALVSKRRGKRSNRAYPASYRDYVVGLVRDNYPDFGPTFAAETLAKRHDVKVHPETLRQWMILDGLWMSRSERRRKQVHQPRHRRECYGELVQIDGSDHEWFEDRGPQCTLLVYIDDATGALMELRFVESESAFDYFRATRSYVERHGRPVAFYSDKHSVFYVAKKAGIAQRGLTQFGRAMEDLQIEVMCANTSQAKGRVERVNRTLQDRLVKALRLEGISDMEAANAFAQDFIDDFNAQFARPARNPKDLHRPAPEVDILNRAFSWQVERRVTSNLTLQYNRLMFLLDPKSCSDVVVHETPDGDISIRWQGRVLPYSLFDKDQIVTQAAVVENKRLDAVLAHVRDKQRETSEKVLTRNSGTKCSINPLVARRRAEHQKLLEEEPSLPQDGKDRSGCFTCTRTVSKVLTFQHRYVRYFLIDQPDPDAVIGRDVTLCESPDGTVEVFLDRKPMSYRKTVLKEVPHTGDGRQDVRSRRRARASL